MLTLQSIIDEVQIATRSELRDEMGQADFANRVGRRWSRLHRWRYLDGGSYVFTTVADQTDYVLPKDFGEWQRVYGEKDEYTAYDLIHVVPWPDWHSADRRDFGTFYGRFLGAVKHEKVTVDGREEPRYILSLTPKPQEGREMRFTYRKAWVPLEFSDDPVNIPLWAEEPFLELVRIMAIAFSAPSTDGNPEPMSALVTNFKQGENFQDAKRQDGAQQPVIYRGAGAMVEVSIRDQMNTRHGPRWTGQDLLADV